MYSLVFWCEFIDVVVFFLAVVCVTPATLFMLL